MDLLDDLLSGVRARGAVFCRSVARPPWAVRFESPAPLSLGTMLRGVGWIARGDADPVRVGEGDIVLIRGGAPIVAGDRPGTEPEIVVLDADRCYAAADGPDTAGHNFRLGPRTYGLVPDGADLFVTAEYPMRGDVCERLLAALPPLALVPAQPEFAPLLELLSVEVARDEPGQQIILDRMLDMLLVRALRAWFGRPEAAAPAGYRALGDPEVGRALRLLHERPAKPWTVAELAAAAGLSRSVFARRFAELVGRPPLAYLTEWRMTLAADLLREDGATVASVARRVGYADGFAFSNAFKRVRGAAPSSVLRGAAAAAAQEAP